MTPLTLDWGMAWINQIELNSRVLEVGSRNVNGSFREPITMLRNPAEYIGVDLESGPGVDALLSVYELTKWFGSRIFDVVVCTEMLEHVEDWRRAVYELKEVTAYGGLVIITTRTPGFRRHDFPSDYWRFTGDQLRTAFADLSILDVTENAEDRGVYLIAQKWTNAESEFPTNDVAAVGENGENDE